jgi:hypothetical protein
MLNIFEVPVPGNRSDEDKPAVELFQTRPSSLSAWRFAGIDEADFHALAARLEFVGNEVADALDCRFRCRLKATEMDLPNTAAHRFRVNLWLVCYYPAATLAAVRFTSLSATTVNFSSASSFFFECLSQIFGNVISVLSLQYHPV